MAVVIFSQNKVFWIFSIKNAKKGKMDRRTGPTRINTPMTWVVGPRGTIIVIVCHVSQIQRFLCFKAIYRELAGKRQMIRRPPFPFPHQSHQPLNPRLAGRQNPLSSFNR